MENKNKETNDSATIYLKEKLKECVGSIQAFIKKIYDDQGTIQILRKEIESVKKEYGEDGYDQVKDKVSKLQKLHYDMFLLDSNLKQMQAIVYEFSTMANVLGVDVGLSDESKKSLDNISLESPHTFMVQGGEVVEAPTQVANIIRTSFAEKVGTDKALREIYENF